MHFDKHSELAGTHAMFGASNYHWTNYSDDKFEMTFRTLQAARRGTEMHDLARRMIDLGVRLPETGETINMYVNDAIDMGMQTEVVLRYSDNFFGTTDTIRFADETYLNVHDYKSGRVPASIKQNYVYSALFCLEYRYRPHNIVTELRIYQNNDVLIHPADPDLIAHIMDRIVTFDARIEEWRREEMRK